MNPPGKPDSSDWDVVDQASLESFPASDPPAWGSHRAAPSADTVMPPELDAMRCAERSALRVALRVVAVSAGVAGLVFLGSRLYRRSC